MQWIAKRNMPAYKVGKLWKFKLSEVDDWIRSGGAAMIAKLKIKTVLGDSICCMIKVA